MYDDPMSKVLGLDAQTSGPIAWLGYYLGAFALLLGMMVTARVVTLLVESMDTQAQPVAARHAGDRRREGRAAAPSPGSRGDREARRAAAGRQARPARGAAPAGRDPRPGRQGAHAGARSERARRSDRQHDRARATPTRTRAERRARTERARAPSAPWPARRGSRTVRAPRRRRSRPDPTCRVAPPSAAPTGARRPFRRSRTRRRSTRHTSRCRSTCAPTERRPRCACITDPGNGFGREARRFALTQRLSAGARPRRQPDPRHGQGEGSLLAVSGVSARLP